MAFDISKLSNREKNLLGILLLMASSLPFFYLTLPTWNKYTGLATKIRQDKKSLQELGTRIKKLVKYKIENIQLAKKLENQKLYLAKSYEIDFLVQDLKNICDESSISLESFTPSNPEPINIVLEKQIEEETQGNQTTPGTLKQALEKFKGQNLPVDLYRFPIEVKITGNFTDIIELFKKLEKYGRVISVENISIGKVQAKKTTGNRLTKSKSTKQQEDSSGLYGSFDLVAYSLAKEGETLPFSALQTKTETFKFKKKRK